MNIHRLYKGICLAVLAVTAFGVTSCKDEPDKYEVAGGTPSINYIRCVSSEIDDKDSIQHPKGEQVESASPQSILCLVGDNLRSVYEIWFNDQKAILNSSYITDNTLLVQVPRSVPDKVSNKIFMITQAGDTIAHDFKVTIPAPSVTSMSCEYAKPGTTATLYGDYIVNDPGTPLEIVFPDGQKATDCKVNAARTSVTFTVPDCTKEGPITVSSIYGETETTFHYLDTRGMMFDFDGKTGLGNHGWHDRPIGNTDGVGITGNYVQLGNGTATLDADGGWNDSDFFFQYWAGDWSTPTNYPEREGIRLFDLVDFTDFSNMAIKFEMYVPKSNPWSSGALQVIFAGTDRLSYGNGGTDVYGNTVKGPNNDVISDNTLPRALYRPWTDTGSYDTGDEWVTVTLPISTMFVYGADGSVSTGQLHASDFANLTVCLLSGGVSGAACTPIVKIDNIRAVPYK